MPSACTINLLYVTATYTGTGAGTDVINLTVVKNNLETAMSCNVSSNNTVGQIITNSCSANPVSLGVGDSVALKWTHNNPTPVVHFGSGLRCQ